jgi:RNA polymerase sigma-70 factor, ECF subfamily
VTVGETSRSQVDSYLCGMEPRARFEILFRAHCGQVRAFAHRRVPSAAADEVVSDVFLIAWRRIDEAPDDALPWLFGIARGVIANRRRGDARREALHERLAATAVPEIDPGPDSGIRESPLLAALATLSERDREVLRLVAWDGLDRGQAAKVLGISAGALRLRLHRARRRLRRTLQATETSDRRADDPSAVEAL